MGTVRKICQQRNNSGCTGYSCHSPSYAPQQQRSQALFTELMSGPPDSSPASSQRPPSAQTPPAFSQHLQEHFHPSILVRGRGRGPSSPTLWTIFLISSPLKLNQDWMMTVQRRDTANSSSIGSQQPPPPRPQSSPTPFPSLA